MKRNFLTAAAVMVTTLFVGTTIAQASDISFSGQVRPRYEMIEFNDYNENTSANSSFSTRVRFNVKANANPDTSAFLQFQSVGLWGGASGQESGTRFATGGGGAEANDQLSDVGLHQVYFTLKNFAGQPVDLTVGRQEAVLDGHRLLGNTGWTQGAQTHDAIKAVHAAGNHVFAYVFSKGAEQGRGGGITVSGETAANNAGDTNDVNSHVFWGNLQGVAGGDVSVYYVYLDNNSNQNGGDLQTIGLRHKGKMMGLDYRGEYYHQFGGGGAYSSGSAISTGYSSLSPDIDAYMFGLRIGKTFKNVTWTPTVTLWYDELSGTSGSDIDSNEWGQFHTLFDTGHKFYGYMDNFLGASGAGTGGLGLEDFAVKVKLKPRDNWTLKADLHYFHTNVDASDGTIVAANTSLHAASDDDLGQELDLTLVNNYNANTKLVLGYSHYWATQTFGNLNGRAAANTATGNHVDGADWAYVMMDVKF
jgi:hypothetical protein